MVILEDIESLYQRVKELHHFMKNLKQDPNQEDWESINDLEALPIFVDLAQALNKARQELETIIKSRK